MKDRFRDRTQAGEFLARRLQRYADRGDVVVLGLPRGGIAVAAEIAFSFGRAQEALLYCARCNSAARFEQYPEEMERLLGQKLAA